MHYEIQHCLFGHNFISCLQLSDVQQIQQSGTVYWQYRNKELPGYDIVRTTYDTEV